MSTQTDVSKTGWEVVSNGVRTRAALDSTKNLEYINVSRIASSSFWTPTVLKEKRYDVSYRQHVCTGIVENERRGGGSEPGNVEGSRDFFFWNRSISITVEYLPSKLNTVADQKFIWIQTGFIRIEAKPIHFFQIICYRMITPEIDRCLLQLYSTIWKTMFQGD